MNALMERPNDSAIEAVIVAGDLSKLTPAQRVSYYQRLCESLGLNPLTKPFEYLTLSGKLTLYARKDATEQLRKLHGVSITDLTSQRLEDVFVVTAKATDKTGRTDAATGAVPIGNKKGEDLANALMKAETKAKRRVTLSICGLGMLDETELETIASVSHDVVEAPAAIPAILPVGESARTVRQDTGRDPGTSYAPAGLTHGREVPEGCVYLSRVEGKNGKSEGFLHLVGEEGRDKGYACYKAQLVDIARQCCQDGVPVRLTIKSSASGNEYVVMVEPVPVGKREPRGDRELDHSEPVDLDSVPF